MVVSNPQELVQILRTECYGRMLYPDGKRFKKKGFRGAEFFFVQCGVSNDPFCTIPSWCDPNMDADADEICQSKMVQVGGIGKGFMKRIEKQRRLYAVVWLDGQKNDFQIFAWIPGFTVKNKVNKEIDDSLCHFCAALNQIETIISSQGNLKKSNTK